MRLDYYIILSVFFHLLIISSFSTALLPSRVHLPVFNVDIVSAPEAEKPKPAEEIKPEIKRSKPVIIKRRVMPPEKNLLPETLFGEGTGSTDDSAKSHESKPPQPVEKSSESVTENKLNQDSKDDESGLRMFSEKTDKDLSLLPPSLLFDKDTIKDYALKNFTPQKGLSFDTREFNNRGYMKMLRDKIENAWKYPNDAARKGISGDLYITFLIKKDGTLGEVKILRTSGYRELDLAAVKALRDAEPYWPLPDDWKQDHLEIKGHFIYIYGTTFVM